MLLGLLSKKDLLIVVLAAIVFSPQLYQMVNKVTAKFGLVISMPFGAPNLSGQALHAVVFAYLLKVLT